jgi:ribosomal protein L21
MQVHPCSFDQVILVDNNGSPYAVGTPVLSNATVNATVIGNQKGDKVSRLQKEET